MSELTCFNCGLPWIHVRARLPRKARNDYEQDGFDTLSFCSTECAYQTAFLRLHTVSTPTTINRYLGGKPISYADFRRQVRLELTRKAREPSDCYETGSYLIDSTMAKMPILELLIPEVLLPERFVTRPRKYQSNAARQRAYRDRLKTL